MEELKLIEVLDVTKDFPLEQRAFLTKAGRKSVKALDGVSFSIKQGEVMGLAGQSGSGKSTLAHILVGLLHPTYGKVVYRGKDIASLKGTSWKQWKREVQMVFQDPYNSLNPRFSVLRNTVEPLRIHGMHRSMDERAAAADALSAVGLDPSERYFDRFPYQLSGGEKQRVALARCLVTGPRFIVADEPVSMLDVSIRASFLELLKGIQRHQTVSVLYISHNLLELGALSHNLAILYHGCLVEFGETSRVLGNPMHPHTQMLLSATLGLGNDRNDYKAQTSTWDNSVEYSAQSCAFSPVCDRRRSFCQRTRPQMIECEPDHLVACHLAVYA